MSDTNINETSVAPEDVRTPAKKRGARKPKDDFWESGNGDYTMVPAGGETLPTPEAETEANVTEGVYKAVSENMPEKGRKSTSRTPKTSSKETEAKAQRAKGAAGGAAAEGKGSATTPAPKEPKVTEPKEPKVLTGELLPAIIKAAEERGAIDGKNILLLDVLPKPFETEAEARAAADDVVKTGQVFSTKLFDFLQREGAEKLGYTGLPGSKGDWLKCLKIEFADKMSIGARAFRYIEQSHTVLDNLRDHIQESETPLLEPADLALFSADTLRVYADLEPEQQVHAAVLTIANAPKTKDKRARPKVTANLARQVTKGLRAPTLTERAAGRRVGAATTTVPARRTAPIDKTPGEAEVTNLTIVGEPEYSAETRAWIFKFVDEVGFAYLASIPFDTFAEPDPFDDEVLPPIFDAELANAEEDETQEGDDHDRDYIPADEDSDTVGTWR